MKNYKHLTAADRKAIEVLLNLNHTKKEIAKELGMDHTTICREIKKRSTPNGYFAHIAHLEYLTLRKHSRKRKRLYHSKTKNYVYNKLQVGWSPEQISGRMKIEQRSDYICKETIYKFIYEDNIPKEEKWYQYLRYGHKKRKKWGGRRKHKNKIPNRVSIYKRPKIVERRVEYGHWEGDSVLYPNKKVINTMNELKTGIVSFKKLDNKSAELTAKAMEETTTKYKVKTITVDNGLEFAKHESITKSTGANIYFCDPYSSWQRGSNENSNMLLRGYLPKRHNIDKLTQEELDDITWELNNRPRKRLGFRTPMEVYLNKFSKSSNESCTSN
jgi:transposase, IS30 family